MRRKHRKSLEYKQRKLAARSDLEESLAMAHMPATGVSGLDLYVNTADSGWRWLAVAMPQAQENEVTLCSGLPGGHSIRIEAG